MWGKDEGNGKWYFNGIKGNIILFVVGVIIIGYDGKTVWFFEQREMILWN